MAEVDDDLVAEESWALRCSIPRITLEPNGTLPCGPSPYIAQLPAGRNAVLAHRLRRENLMEEMGNVTCRVPSIIEGIEEMALGEYIQDWLDRKVNRNATQNRYLFGSFGDAWELLQSDYVRPCCRSCGEDFGILTPGLGGLHSGAPWHNHMATFLEVIHGAKHVALLPPGDPVIPEIEEGIRHLSQVHWHLEKRWQLEQAGRLGELQECVIEPGEVLYFPDDWYHGVVNMAPYTAFVSTFV